MAKEKVTLTRDAAKLHELRALVRARSRSVSIDDAIEAHVQHKRQLSAIDAWLAEMERQHGPVPVETLQWAARLVNRWNAARRSGRRARPNTLE